MSCMSCMYVFMSCMCVLYVLYVLYVCVVCMCCMYVLITVFACVCLLQYTKTSTRCLQRNTSEVLECSGPLSANAAHELHVLGKDGNALGVDGAQVSVFKQNGEISLRRFLQSH